MKTDFVGFELAGGLTGHMGLAAAIIGQAVLWRDERWLMSQTCADYLSVMDIDRDRFLAKCRQKWSGRIG